MSEEILNDHNIEEAKPLESVEMHPITGKVAKVISNREVALNIGKTGGVREGMLFDIVVPGSLEITDPETGELLGTVRPGSKARVRVFSVNDRFSLATTYRTTGFGGISLRGDLPFARQVETLKTRDTLHEAFTERAGYVTAGDPVVQVIDGT